MAFDNVGRTCRIVAVLSVGSLVCADEAAIRANLKAYFATQDGAARAALVQSICSDPAYEQAAVAGWLAQLERCERVAAGVHEIDVPIDGGAAARRVSIRIPRGYDPQNAWPLIYALHGTGGDGPSILRYLEHVLGDDVDEFIIAAPSAYTHYAIQVEPPHSTQHLDVLRAVKQRFRVDSDRVYLTGYSRGGHGSWTVGVLHADQFAAVIPVAGTLILPEVDRLWDPFLPNVANTYVLNVWGANDRFQDDGTTLATDGGIAGLNRRLRDAAARLKLPIESVEDEEKGHSDVLVPLPELRRALKRVRDPWPARVRHTFRDAYQASAYWLEGREWTGPAWDGQAFNVEMQAGETGGDAIARFLRGRLGEIAGERDGQTLTLRRKKVRELVVWFGDGMIDWSKPVTIRMSGKAVFEGVLQPDLDVCLSEAARSFDFQRLRWAGVRVKRGKAEVIRAR